MKTDDTTGKLAVVKQALEEILGLYPQINCVCGRGYTRIPNKLVANALKAILEDT